MGRKSGWVLGALLGAAPLSAVRPPGGPASAQETPGLSYEASCEVEAAGGAVRGSVANSSADRYQVNGTVRFIFSAGGSLSRPSLDVSASAFVAPGQRVEVARARLPFVLGSGEQCRFEVKDAIRRL